MSVNEALHQNHGYSEPKIKATYKGLLLRDGKLVACVESLHEGIKTSAYNGLVGTAEMVAFEIDLSGGSWETLDKATEIRPLAELVFASIALNFGMEGTVRPDLSMKEPDEFMKDGLARMEALGPFPAGLRETLVPLLEANKNLWPNGILTLIRDVQELTHKPLPGLRNTL